MFQLYVPNVSSVFQTYVCKCFIWTLHMFFKVFQTYIPSVSSVFVRMLQMFYLDVSKVDMVLQQVFRMHVSSVPYAFRCMLQVLHLDVSKIDRVLYLPPRFLLPHLGVSSSSRRRLGIDRPLSLFSMLVTLRATRVLRGPTKWCENRPQARASGC